MTKISRALAVVLVLLAGLWLMADTLVPQPFSYFSFRAKFMQFSGVLAIGAMSLCMVLAARPHWLEPHLDGLDKMYRLHKWLGITALVTAVAHWWLGQGTKWMTGWGWIERRPRGPRPPQVEQGVVEAFLGVSDKVVEIQREIGQLAEVGSSLSTVTFGRSLDVGGSGDGIGGAAARAIGLGARTKRNVLNRRLLAHREDFLAGDYLLAQASSLAASLGARAADAWPTRPVHLIVPSGPGSSLDLIARALGERLAATWSLATALSLIVWYIFAPQCLSTLAVVRRETNSWKWALFMLIYMTALAYLASFATFRLVGWLSGAA